VGSLWNSSQSCTAVGWDLHFVADTQNLSNINIAALCVDLRIVRIKHRRIDSVVGCNSLACIVFLHNIRRRTVLSCVSQTDASADLQVGAFRVDVRMVDRQQLVCRHVMRCSDAVADVPSLDRVASVAGSGRDEQWQSQESDC